MTEKSKNFPRLLILALLSTILVIGIILVVMALSNAGKSVEAEKINALANNKDSCVICHKQETVGIIEQYGSSAMARANVTCRDCHEVAQDYPGASEHEGTYVLSSPTTKMCQRCHEQEFAQFTQSRHGLPSYVAVFGSQDLSAELLANYESIPEGTYAPDKSRNDIAAIEGTDVTRFTCEPCHNIGKPAPDLSVGQCQKCHLRHYFSLEQARKPETCNACHIGPDHPQWEIYQESAHGIAYMTLGDDWGWHADPGTLTVKEFPSPTCATCHISGFGSTAGSHDIGERLTWYLFAPISTRRPDWQDNAARMQAVCLECHNSVFVAEFYADADALTGRVNEWVEESNVLMQPLKDQGLLTAEPFDEPIDYVYFELWHHWGRTTKFGSWMQGADYAQWHGAYELISDLAELEEMVEERLSGK